MRYRFIGLLAIVLAAVLIAACGSGTPKATTDPSSAATHPDPEPQLRAIVGKFNDGDYEGFYNELSSDRKRQVTLTALNNALDSVRALTGGIPTLEVATITAKRVSGDNAEVDATLNVKLQGTVLPVTATAQLKWEKDNWRLADHFLDQALSVIGFAGIAGDTGGTVVPTASP
ncbi:MAG: hypothetical protein ABI559_10700 [Chloroflexota bacterium]